MIRISGISVFLVLALLFYSCKDEAEYLPPPEPNLVFKFKFDGNQERLDNYGQLDNSIPPNHATQSPVSSKMSSNYIELSSDSVTPLGDGTVVFRGAETSLGGSTAIDFSQSTSVSNGNTFFSIPLKDVAAATYKYLRVSIAYQNYSVQFMDSGVNYIGTIAAFTGYNTYITTLKPKNKTITINANRLQGFYAFEFNAYGTDSILTGYTLQTTVPNPIYNTSPNPPGSSVITGFFDNPLIITGNETKDITVEVSLSINNSFEWKDLSSNFEFEPFQETIVNMGIRGLQAKIVN
jgi:hypothetical protein